MSYPRLIVDLNKIKTNVKTMVGLANNNGMKIAGVTKVFCAGAEIAQAYIDGGVSYFADSRVENLKKLEQFSLQKIMLRLPMISQAIDTVKYADISLNSELETIKALSEAARELGKVHKIILMIDLGDLREGYFNEDELYNVIDEIIKLDGVQLIGLGTNLTCYGGVIPNKKILDKLNLFNNEIKEKHNITLDIISGGNSSSVYLLDKEDLGSINNLRLGESLVFGTESAYGEQIPGTNSDAFTLEVEVIEIKEKPSVPTEEIGRDAFGKVPTFVDRGVRKRILCAVGKQDIDLDTIYPKDESIIVLGGSSDHLILDGTDSEVDYKVGDIISFNIHYVALLRAMTSEYIEKIYI